MTAVRTHARRAVTVGAALALVSMNSGCALRSMAREHAAEVASAKAQATADPSVADPEAADPEAADQQAPADPGGNPAPQAVAGPSIVATPPAAPPAATTLWTYSMAGGRKDPNASWTCRMFARVQYDASALRVRLSNVYGQAPAHLAKVSAGRRTSVGAAATGILPVTFGGKRAVTIPAGSSIWSDPINVSLKAGQSLAVSVHVSSADQWVSFHRLKTQSAFCGSGDRTADTGGSGLPTRSQSVYVDALASEHTAAKSTIVWLGDSIGEGTGLPQDSYTRMTDVLADRLHAQGIAVVNMSVSGQALVRDRVPESKGASLEHRFASDALGLPGVQVVVVATGLNDLRWGVTSARVVQSLTGLAKRLNDAHLLAFVSTLSPYKGYGKYSQAAENGRLAVNQKLREDTLGFLALIDSAQPLTDPNGTVLAAKYDYDHMHPNAAGHVAVAETALAVLRATHAA
ncbi:MAG: family lipolytic protein [Frankiales bacterium]|nr:family lipolytic protein [Frankiales bacterium]